MFSRHKSKNNKNLVAPTKATRDLASRVVREASWFSLLFIGLYITLALISYSGIDPSFSHSIDASKNINNLAGISGAYFSDFFLNIFGLSAWWLVFLSVYSIFLIYPRIENENYQIKHLLIIHYLGFLVLLLSSSTFEAGYAIDISAQLPSEQGGILGNNLYTFLERAMGYIGTLVFLAISFAIGFSLFTGWSWITISESIGNFICNLCNSCIEKFEDWQDRKEGKKFEKQRTSFVEAEKKKLEDRDPVKILDIKSPAKESIRVKQEKQTNLFGDSDSILPPLNLLDQPTKQVSVQSSETIEFISRLIEKKLLDFGIEAKVISAQPGPVITRYEFEPAAGVKGSQVINLAKDLARALSVVSVRVVETIQGKLVWV